MPYSKSPVFIPAQRVQNYHYAIRNIVGKALLQEQRGKTVTYLNIGDPILYGFQPPAELVAATARAMEQGNNGYAPSAGRQDAVEAIAADAASRGIATSPENVIITFGASEAADLVCTAMLNPGDEVLCPVPGYPLYSAIIAKLNARESRYRLDPANGWMPDPKDIERRITSRTKILVVINPNNPTGELYPAHVLKELADIARRHQLLVITDEVYHKLVYEGTHIPFATFADSDVAVISFDSLSKNYMAPGWRVGWMIITNGHLVPDVRQAFLKLADARLCAPMAPQFAIQAAMDLKNGYLDGIMARLHRQRDVTVRMLNAIDGITCNHPGGAFYVMGKIDLERFPFSSDEDFVLRLLEEKQILFVHGSGFGTEPSEGFFRVVYLPDAETLERVYGELADFMSQFT